MSLNNEVRIIGNLVKDPEIIETERGKFGKLRVASNTKRGENEETLYIDVKLFGYAYNDLEYHQLIKADKVLVYGRLKIDEYEDKNGNQRREPVIYANNVMKINKRTTTSAF